jgi:hypothetical protein
MSEGVIRKQTIQITPILFCATGAGKENIITTQNAQTDYTVRNKQATPFYHDGGQTATKRTFTRRIGSTTYRVGVHFSKTSKETMDEKILRLVRNEAISGKAAGL